MPCAGFGDAVTVRVSPLPVELGPGPFSTAQARRLGVPAVRLGRGDLVHPTRGAHAAEPETPSSGPCLPVAMPTIGRSRTTAAVLWGCRCPEALEEVVSVEAPAPRHRAHRGRHGAPARRRRAPRARARAVATPAGTGLRVVDVADTWCDLGELPRGRSRPTTSSWGTQRGAPRCSGRAGRGRPGAARGVGARNRPRGAVVLPARAGARATRGALTHGEPSPADVRRRRLPRARGERAGVGCRGRVAGGG